MLLINWCHQVIIKSHNIVVYRHKVEHLEKHIDSTDPLSTQYRSGESSPGLPQRDERGHRKQSSNRSWGLVLV